MIEKLDIKQWLELNSKLQQKKNALRKALKEKGVLKKDKTNDYDHYSYFSEAGYKELFTELFSKCGLELTSNEIAYESFETTSEKQQSGRKVTFEFKLSDIDTGFYEVSKISGEGFDKGDKAGYKADTGAIKYYLANTFLVATGDDAEQDSPVAKRKTYPMTDKQKNVINNMPMNWKNGLISQYGSLELTKDQAKEAIDKYYIALNNQKQADYEAKMSEHEGWGDR